jgi:hypothetical protein
MIRFETDINSWVIYCDFCSNYEEFPEEKKFKAVVKRAKEMGWRTFLTNTGWANKCPVCCDDLKRFQKGEQ